MSTDYGHSCEGGRTCTLHNLHCAYPACEKGKRDRKAKPGGGPRAREPEPAPEPTGSPELLRALKSLLNRPTTSQLPVSPKLVVGTPTPVDLDIAAMIRCVTEDYQALAVKYRVAERDGISKGIARLATHITDQQKEIDSLVAIVDRVDTIRAESQTECARLRSRIAQLEAPSQPTHYEGCWTEGRSHYACALARIEALEREKANG